MSSRHPQLKDAYAENISTFLLEYSAYEKSVGVEVPAVPLRECIEESLLEGFELAEPKIRKSTAELKSFLRALSGFDSIEDAYSAFNALVMDESILEPRARVFKYLQQFNSVKNRASEYNIAEKALLRRFAKGVRPLGLSESLLLRIADDVLESFSELVESTLNDAVDFARTSGWKKRTSSSLDSVVPISKKGDHQEFMKNRSQALAQRLCFRCHKPGHVASA
ncbi:hypothetical protein RCL1_007704 [Eukaryota sp. TZLM3-RCL]